MRLFLLLLLACSQLLYSQSTTKAGAVNLIIEDETDQGFFLGINGFLQNTEKQKALVVTELDTIPYLLHIDSDTFNFQKTIHLRERTSHRFVLTKNFHGDLKLRYRGTRSSIPATLASHSYERSVAWPDHLKKPEKQIAATQISSPEEKAPVTPKLSTEDADSTQLVEIDPASPPGEQNDVLLPFNDTLREKEREVVLSEPEFEIQPFDNFISELRQIKFEFERLSASKRYVEKNTISAEELKQIFKNLQYDQTRLQLFREAHPKVMDPQNLEILKSALEYEISKMELEKLLADE